MTKQSFKKAVALLSLLALPLAYSFAAEDSVTIGRVSVSTKSPAKIAVDIGDGEVKDLTKILNLVSFAIVNDKPVNVQVQYFTTNTPYTSEVLRSGADSQATEIPTTGPSVYATIVTSQVAEKNYNEIHGKGQKLLVAKSEVYELPATGPVEPTTRYTLPADPNVVNVISYDWDGMTNLPGKEGHYVSYADVALVNVDTGEYLAYLTNVYISGLFSIIHFENNFLEAEALLEKDKAVINTSAALPKGSVESLVLYENEVCSLPLDVSFEKVLESMIENNCGVVAYKKNVSKVEPFQLVSAQWALVDENGKPINTLNSITGDRKFNLLRFHSTEKAVMPSGSFETGLAVNTLTLPELPTSINNPANGGVEIYNGAQGNITVKGENLKALNIYNVNGAAAVKEQINAAEKSINSLSSGVYIVEVLKKDGKPVRKKVLVK